MFKNTARALLGSTIVVALANGKTVIGRNMWQVGELSVATQEGVSDVRFEGFSGAVTED